MPTMPLSFPIIFWTEDIVAKVYCTAESYIQSSHGKKKDKSSSKYRMWQHHLIIHVSWEWKKGCLHFPRRQVYRRSFWRLPECWEQILWEERFRDFSLLFFGKLYSNWRKVVCISPGDKCTVEAFRDCQSAGNRFWITEGEGRGSVIFEFIFFANFQLLWKCKLFLLL